MTAFELKLARAIAEDDSIDLSNVNYDALIGFGCADFVPVHVPIRAVARCIRWQCCCFDGSWDDRQWNEDRPFYLKNVNITDLHDHELRGFLVQFCLDRLAA